MTETTGAEARSEAIDLADRLAAVGNSVLAKLGFTMERPPRVQIDIGTDDHPDEARITLTWTLPPEVRATLARGHKEA